MTEESSSGRRCETALLDGQVSALEEADLELVAHLLGLGPGALEAGLDVAARRLAGRADRAALEAHPGGEPPAPTASVASLAGQTVCFTGALLGRIDGAPITRGQAHRLAEAAGLVVRDRVTRDLDILVVADPHTQSTKARNAARYGTRIMAEAAFWRAIGVQVE